LIIKNLTLFIEHIIQSPIGMIKTAILDKVATELEE